VSIDDYESYEPPDEAALAQAGDYAMEKNAEMYAWLRDPPEGAVAVACLPCWTRNGLRTVLGYVGQGVDLYGNPMAWYPCVRRARDRGGRREMWSQLRDGQIETSPVHSIRDEQWARRDFVGRQQTEGSIDVRCRQCPRRFTSKVGRLRRQVADVEPGGTYYV